LKDENKNNNGRKPANDLIRNINRKYKEFDGKSREEPKSIHAGKKS